MNSLFCRHNRFTADCPICSKGTVLDSSATGTVARPRVSGKPRAAKAAAAPAQFRGPYASVTAGDYAAEADSYTAEAESTAELDGYGS